MSKTRFIENTTARQAGQKADLDFLSREQAETARNFFSTFEGYKPTPLVALPGLAQDLGIASFHVKDESKRFGLNAFKVLGGGYAIANHICELLDMPISEMSMEKLCSKEVRKAIGEVTFVSATDGNHGRGVAWAAKHLGQSSVIYMPKGSAQSRLKNIQAEGAEASITDMNYDDAVRLAWKQSQEKGWVMVQDTAWDGYEKIPAWIMQGYTTLAYEALEQLEELKAERPTHVFLQAGVGSFAGGIQGLFAAVFGDERPKTVIVEPELADCIFRSAEAADGKAHFVTGDMNTVMAGLACGEPNTVGWGILRDYSDGYISCPDWVAANGMRILAAPRHGDPKVVSGESGAVTTGIVECLMTRPDLAEIREKLGLDEHSRVMVISTEGDTDPDMYRRITWYGAYPEQD
ncbi:diaminopropionate ammonia-lyase [Desulfobaculum bizertense]|uniref:diaminopropionate ammonia-lyase n=1 Tax=Desulfobaculum bizertense TaxID=376490 RepID=UPI001F39F181|nr:diaminopropionate ammonia-lyase [Desulfobaculum bizertense]UIJ38634.1 diaminopropionate ammonia-lyase [Desulfobaculum bizertense]